MIQIFTDGGLKNNKAAWAYLILKDGHVLQEKASVAKTNDSNHAEILAAIAAIESIPVESEAILYSDSRVLVDGMTKHYDNWEKSDFMNRHGEPVAYAKDFQKLYRLTQERHITWRWVRAHAGNAENERCDALCRKLLERILK